MALSIFLAPVLAFILTYYLLTKLFRNNDHFWPSRGVRLLTQRNVSSFLDFYWKKNTTTVGLDTAYYFKLKETGDGFGGTMELNTPVLMVADLKLASEIMVKDFDHFVDRRKASVRSRDPLILSILHNLDGAEWKRARTALSPSFSTGKIRRIFQNFVKSAEHLVDFISKRDQVRTGIRLEMHEVSIRYIIDVILNTAFGVETTDLEDSRWYDMARRLQQPSWDITLNSWMLVNFPRTAKLLGLNFLPAEPLKFFVDAVTSIQAQRRRTGEVREDFLQLMLESQSDVFTEGFITAQSLSFFFGALEAPGSLLTFCGYMLAMYPEVQERLRSEVDDAFKMGGIDYDTVVQHMKYMDMFIQEVLRMFPPGAGTERLCTKDYVIPGTQIRIPKGTLVTIPIFAIQNDERYFERPNEFNPERFSPENKSKLIPHSILGFGLGPRNCIGMRFGLVEVKVGLSYLVRNFTVSSAPGFRTVEPGILRREDLDRAGFFLEFHIRNN